LAYPSSFGSLGPEFKSQRPHHLLLLFLFWDNYYFNLLFNHGSTENFKYQTLEEKNKLL